MVHANFSLRFRLLSHIHYIQENNFNQNYGTRFGFNVIAANEVYVAVLL